MKKYQQKKLANIINTIAEFEAGGMHGQLPVVWKSATGATVTDIFGEKYIDFTSTIFVTNAGHDAVSKAIQKQAKKMIHCYTFPTAIKAQYLTELKAFLPTFCERIMFASAGSEVTSWAINLMRKHSKKPIIVHIDGAFHGKTGSVERLNDEEMRIPFAVSSKEEVLDIIHALSAIKENIAGIMIESYQGWSARLMNKEYVQTLCKFAKDSDIPVCFDEVQAGFWRTGKKFAYEWYEVEPDLICIGKAMGNGYPLSALAGYNKFFDEVQGLSSTHSGNPLACACGLAALKVYNTFNETNIGELSSVLSNGLKAICNQVVWAGKVSYECTGMVASLIFNDTFTANEVCNACVANGLLVVKTGKQSVKIGPPLVISKEELMEGISKLNKAVTYAFLNNFDTRY